MIWDAMVAFLLFNNNGGSLTIPAKKPSSMHKSTTHRLQSTWRAILGPFAPLSKPISQESSSGKFYLSIEQTPLSVFISVIVSNDVSKLIYEPGQVDPDALAQAWDKILEAYIDATLSDEDRYLMTLIETANVLTYNIAKAQAAQRYLTFKYDEEIVKILIKMGAVSEGYPKDGSLNSKRVWSKRLTANIKRWAFTLNQTEEKIKQLSPEQKGEDISAAYFDDILARLSQYYRFHINEKEVTVGRFLAMLRDYKQHLSSLKKQAKQD